MRGLAPSRKPTHPRLDNHHSVRLNLCRYPVSLSSDLEWRPDRCQDASEVQRDPRAGSAPLAEDVQVDPRKDSQSSSERFLEIGRAHV